MVKNKKLHQQEDNMTTVWSTLKGNQILIQLPFTFFNTLYKWSKVNPNLLFLPLKGLCTITPALLFAM